MGIPWGPLNARAAGLRGHLLGRSELRRLAAARDPETLMGILPPALRPAGEERRDARSVDRRIGRWAGERLAALDRWAAEHRDALAGLLEAEDRRALRILVRGTAAGLSPEQRLDGLVPTPTLPARLQERAARSDDVEALVECLVHGGHPLAMEFREDEAAERPSPPSGHEERRPGAVRLFELEAALARAFARRAVRGAERAGAAFRHFVSDGVDLENAWTVLASGGARGSRWESLFLQGGRRLSRDAFTRLLEAEDREERLDGLARAFADCEAGRVFAAGRTGGGLERRVLGARLREAAAEARRDPLGPGPLVAFVLTLRAEAADLRRIAWGSSLGAPAELRRPPEEEAA